MIARTCFGLVWFGLVWRKERYVSLSPCISVKLAFTHCMVPYKHHKALTSVVPSALQHSVTNWKLSLYNSDLYYCVNGAPALENTIYSFLWSKDYWVSLFKKGENSFELNKLQQKVASFMDSSLCHREGRYYKCSGIPLHPFIVAFSPSLHPLQ